MKVQEWVVKVKLRIAVRGTNNEFEDRLAVGLVIQRRVEVSKNKDSC